MILHHRFLPLTLLVSPLVAQTVDQIETEEVTPVPKSVPAAEVAEEKKEWPPSGMGLFEKGLALGNIQDNPRKSYRRIYQRTLMPTEPRLYYNAVLTFDDQLVPFSEDEASAMEVMKDLAPRGARAVFFANVPGVASPSLRPFFRIKDRETRKKACRKLLDSKRAEFVKAIRELIKIKKSDQWLAEVHNHTAFHQNMRNFRLGSAQMDLCIVGLHFVEECLDEAYTAERPGYRRQRFFRFPFLAVPRDAKARSAINDVFTELGLLSVGETQDSKDYANGSPDKAYKSLVAARQGKRYDAKSGPYSTAQLPVALFHTKTWRKIGPGVLKALDEAKALAARKEEALDASE